MQVLKNKKLWSHIKFKFIIKSHGATDLLEKQLKEEWSNQSYQCLRKFFEI